MIGYLIGATVSAAAGVYFFSLNPGFGLVWIVPFAWFVSRILIHGGSAGYSFLRSAPLLPWAGQYYEFQGNHLRQVELVDGLAFLEKDVLAVIGRKESAAVLLFGPAERLVDPDSSEMVLTRAGCERLLLKSAHPDAMRLKLWLERDVFIPWDRRHGRDDRRFGDGKPG